MPELRPGNFVLLTMTQMEKDAYLRMGFRDLSIDKTPGATGVCTVDEYQGREHDHVIYVRHKLQSDMIFQSESHALVMASRCKKTCKILTVVDEDDAVSRLYRRSLMYEARQEVVASR